MSRPDDLRYAKSHEWVRVSGEEAEVGITDYAVDQLGDLAFVDLPQEGTQVEAGGSFGEIESTKTVSDLYAPVGGEIVAVNRQLEDNLQLITDGPFTTGWMIRIRMGQPGDLDSLMTAAQYAEHVASEEDP